MLSSATAETRGLPSRPLTADRLRPGRWYSPPERSRCSNCSSSARTVPAMRTTHSDGILPCLIQRYTASAETRNLSAISLTFANLGVIYTTSWFHQIRCHLIVKAFRLVVNRSVTWAEWDDELLSLELQELAAADFNLELTGFDPRELEDLLTLPDNDEQADLAQLRKIGLLIVVWEREEVFQFPRIEARQFQVEVGRGEFLKL